VGLDESFFRKKAMFICCMVRKLLSAYVGLTEEDDRDHVGRKRLETSGELMLSLFTYDFKLNFIDNAKRILQRRLTRSKSNFEDTTQIIFDDRYITNSIRHALSTGQWGKTKMGEVIRSGVSQVLKRDTTYFATLSHLRRIAYPLNTASKIIKLRLLHNTQFGYICPAETPEGQKIGVVKNLALLTRISIELSKAEIDKLLQVIKSSNLIEVYDINVNASSQGLSKVVFNGNFIAYTSSPMKFVTQLRYMRRCNDLNECTSISMDFGAKEVRIMTDGGRMMRPLLIV
jgi:DNA-directed RNA polymerase II subunit RPB2